MGRPRITGHPGSSAVVARVGNGILLVEQFREVVGERLLEIPAGTMEPGEGPEDCARRELVEETGYEPEELHWLYSFYPSPGTSDEVIHVFFAGSVRRVGEPEEGINIAVVGIDEAVRLIRDGIIRDGKTVIGILMAMPRIDPTKRFP